MEHCLPRGYVGGIEGLSCLESSSKGAGNKRQEADEDIRLTCSGKEGKGQERQTTSYTSEWVSVVSKLAHCPCVAEPWAGSRLCLRERYRRAADRVAGVTLWSQLCREQG